MPPVSNISVSLTQGERYRLSESLTLAAGLVVSVSSEGLSIVADTVTKTWDGTGDVAFPASAGHATVTGYAARLRVSGNSTVVDTEQLGKPTPDGNGVIVVNLAGFFAYRAAGDYTISILATDAGGSTDSEESNIFSLPLPMPTERWHVTESITAVRA